jgi:hypothetical protein
MEMTPAASEKSAAVNAAIPVVAPSATARRMASDPAVVVTYAGRVSAETCPMELP